MASMSLAPKDRIGPYEILGPIGAGGMGEVYRARDTRLEREVAIKVLPIEFTRDEERLARFEREARLLASLNHPHIASIYGLEQTDAVRAIVMELIDGQSLAARLGSTISRRGEARGLPWTDVLAFSVQIAGALAAAHRAGVVHRDIKPANIMVTSAGCKLVDFGLGKTIEPGEPPPADGSAPTTRLASVTEPGMLLGTLPYMAPEQLEGKRVDHRSDIFALGAVIYEMATGRRPFEAQSHAGLIAAILDSAPPAISASRPDAPPALDRAVWKCLEKEPERRWQDASDLAEVLSSIEAAPGVSTAGATRAPAWREPRAWMLALATSALTAAMMTGLLSRPSGIDSASGVAFTVRLPDGAEVGRFDPALAFSPDARHLAITAESNGANHLYLKMMDRPEPHLVPGTSGAQSPFFSPDGRWLAFATAQGLVKTAVDGGVPDRLLPMEQFPLGAAWGERDTVVVSGGGRSVLKIVAAETGDTHDLTAFDTSRGEASHRFPQLLPGGRTVIYTAGPPREAAWYEANIVAQPIDGGTPRVLVRGAAMARYAPSGHLVYARAGTLYAQLFDAGTAELAGRAVPVLDGVRESPAMGVAQFAISPAGDLAYVAGGLMTNEVVWVDRAGRVEPLFQTPPRDQLYSPRLSPDGGTLAIVVARGDDDIWTYDIARDDFSRFTSGANHNDPVWTPDGTRLMFRRATTGSTRLLWQPVDRSGDAVAVSSSPIGASASWFPDQQRLLFVTAREGTGRDIVSMAVDTGVTRVHVATPFDESAPAISPDGRWLAYGSDASGRREVYIKPVADGSRVIRVSRGGGTEPLWSRDGQELFYRTGNTMMATRFDGDGVGTPAALFTVPRWGFGVDAPNFDVSPDGQRFVLTRWTEPDEMRTKVHVVLRWADALKELVPR